MAPPDLLPSSPLAILAFSLHTTLTRLHLATAVFSKCLELSLPSLLPAGQVSGSSLPSFPVPSSEAPVGHLTWDVHILYYSRPSISRSCSILFTALIALISEILRRSPDCCCFFSQLESKLCKTRTFCSVYPHIFSTQEGAWLLTGCYTIFVEQRSSSSLSLKTSLLRTVQVSIFNSVSSKNLHNEFFQRTSL